MNDNFDQLATKDLATYAAHLDNLNRQSLGDRHKLYPAYDKYSTEDALHIKECAGGGIQMMYVELKGRYFDISTHPDCIVESYKITNLQRLAWQSRLPVYLVAIYYPSNKLAFWQIDPQRTYSTTQMWCKHQTAGDDTKVEKTMVKFPLREALILDI